jgi:predicted DNA-binding protein YlxM (UPF0122 family)
MNHFILDHYALGLHPCGYEILIHIIDLELGLADSPDSVYVLGFILDGWSQREIAKHMGVHHSNIRRHVRKARDVLGSLAYS